MIPVTDNETAASAKYEIELALLKSRDWQMLANDEVIAGLQPGSCEFAVEWGKLIFAWWDEERSQSWRVTAYEIAEAEIRFRASRGLAKETVTLTLRDPERWRAKQQERDLPAAERRSRYGGLLAQLIPAHFGGARVERVNTAGNRAHSLPVQYARLVVDLRGEIVLAIGVNDCGVQAEIDGVLTAGLVWLAGFNEKREGRKRAKRLWLCVPRDHSQTTLERLTLIETAHLGAKVECLEVDEDREELTAVRPMTQAELLNDHPRELRWPDGANNHSVWRERILSLAPEQIEARHHAAQDAESYSIHGLEFVRVTHCSTIPRPKFGIPGELHTGRRTAGRLFPPVKTLTETNIGELGALVQQIIAYRSAVAADRHHPFYRLRAEAWLESILRQNIRALDAALDPRFVYSQIPTWRADERSVIDLLAANHEGRLVVIEIKAAEDVNLPMQGLDYWLRVEQARVRGEFTRRGLFPGITLADQSPLLYLVAPRLRFHRTFSTVARCISPEVETFRIGLNASWRAGVRVHTKERVNEP